MRMQSQSANPPAELLQPATPPPSRKRPLIPPQHRHPLLPRLDLHLLRRVIADVLLLQAGTVTLMDVLLDCLRYPEGCDTVYRALSHSDSDVRNDVRWTLRWAVEEAGRYGGLLWIAVYRNEAPLDYCPIQDLVISERSRITVAQAAARAEHASIRMTSDDDDLRDGRRLVGLCSPPLRLGRPPSTTDWVDSSLPSLPAPDDGCPATALVHVRGLPYCVSSAIILAIECSVGDAPCAGSVYCWVEGSCVMLQRPHLYTRSCWTELCRELPTTGGPHSITSMSSIYTSDRTIAMRGSAWVATANVSSLLVFFGMWCGCE
jgi:hypothetical protein